MYFTNKNKSMEAYMLGDKQMSVFPVGVSLMTSCLSGLTLLGASAEFFYQGPTYAFAALPMLLSGPITAYTMLPVFYRMNTLSLYKVSPAVWLAKVGCGFMGGDNLSPHENVHTKTPLAHLPTGP